MLRNRSIGHAVLLSLLFGAISFSWSVLGLLYPNFRPFTAQYTPALLQEVGLHFVFGLVAGAAIGRAAFALLAGLEAVSIDSDHFMAAMGFAADARLAHSLFFALPASMLMAMAGRRSDSLFRRDLTAVVTVASFLTHLSYDIAAGDGSFPLLFPVNIVTFDLPYAAWPILEAVAIGACLWVRRRLGHRQ